MVNKISDATPVSQPGAGDPHVTGAGAAGDPRVTGADAAPFLYVVRGQPTQAELAAVVTVLAARQAASARAGRPARAVRSTWSDRSRLMRASVSPGPGAWRRSALPR
jgi:hypothetical protein